MKKYGFLIGILTIGLLLFRCNSSLETAAGATETGNPISGIVFNEDNTISAGADVILFPSDFNPATDTLPDNYTVKTNSDGKYRFNNIPNGTYNIIAANIKNQKSDLLREIAVSGIETDAPDAVLQKNGAINIALENLTQIEEGILYIPGTNIQTEVTSQILAEGMVVIELPPETYSTINLINNQDFSVQNVLENNITVQPEDTARYSQFFNWLYSAKISVNTTATGADITEDIHQFPLLVRLDTDNFNFIQALPDGQDLRFSKPNGFELFYEIEEWDPNNNRAAIWVLADTIQANSNNSIFMHWGFRSMDIHSNANAVFNKNYGWAGVWHLNQDDPDTLIDGLYKNSVEDLNHGNDRVTSDTKSGLIGKGQYFERSDYIQVPEVSQILAPIQKIMSLSVWIKPDTNTIINGTIISLGKIYGININTESSSSPFLNNIVIFGGIGNNLQDGNWHLLNVVTENSKILGYIDGNQISQLDTGSELPPDSTSVLTIGTLIESGTSYKGSLDEIRASNTVRSDSWIKLEFHTQKFDSDVISFIKL